MNLFASGKWYLPVKNDSSFCFKEVLLITLHIKVRWLYLEVGLKFLNYTHTEIIKTMQNSVETGGFFSWMFIRFQKLQNLKDCNNVALGKRGWCVQKQACFCFRGGEEFIFMRVLFFIHHSVKEESTSSFNMIAQENKEEHAFPVTKLPEDACSRSKTQQTDIF